MLWTLPILPILAGAGLWLVGARPDPRPKWSRTALGVGSVAVLAVTLGLAVWAAVAEPAAGHAFGAGLTLEIEVVGVARAVAVLVPAVAIPILVYAAAHEPVDGLARLVGLMTAFVGTMLLLVVAADLLTLLIGWELVGALSYALIAHHWREPDKPRAAAHAFNTTRFGDLGLFLAAGAAFAGTGSLAFADLAALQGPELHVLVAGVLLAAAAKSGQVPFAPWLFSAMGGPTPVSALLHAATMVAAGAYVLARLHPVLELAGWFAPVTITVGLATAIAGGVVAALQHHAKKLLAASTSAHYGLMLVAVGAGYPAVAVAHLIAHAGFKALLFLAAGVATSAVGSPELGRMRLGSHLGATAALAAVGSLALAAVPPLGGAWTKEEVVASAGSYAVWAALLAIVAGGLSALYAARFQLLAFGPHRGEAPSPRGPLVRPDRAVLGSLAALALASLVVGALWLPAVHGWFAGALGGGLPTSEPWELVLSLAVVAVAVYSVWQADRGGRLATYGLRGRARTAADWLGLPRLTERVVVAPVLALAAAASRFDDRVVDGAVTGLAGAGRRLATALPGFDDRVVDSLARGVATASGAVARGLSSVAELGVDGVVRGLSGLFAAAGRDTRRSQTGLVHHYYLLVGAGAVVLAAVAGLWR